MDLVVELGCPAAVWALFGPCQGFDPPAVGADEIPRLLVARHVGDGQFIEVGVALLGVAGLREVPDRELILVGPGLFQKCRVGHLVDEGLLLEGQLQVFLCRTDLFKQFEMAPGMDGLGGGDRAKEPRDLGIPLLLRLPGKGQQPEVGLGLPCEGSFHIPACRFCHGHLLFGAGCNDLPGGNR